MTFCVLANQHSRLPIENLALTKQNSSKNIFLHVFWLICCCFNNLVGEHCVFVSLGFPGPVGERHCACAEHHWTAGGHSGHPC